MPSQECTCDADDTVKAEYPTWATAEQITLAYDAGKVNWEANTATAEAAANVVDVTDGSVTNGDGVVDTDTPVTKPDVWPACDASITCESDFYLNRLACVCFAKTYCQDAGCSVEEDLLPTEQCQCATQSDIRAIYPDWADLTDVEKAVNEGLAEANQDGTAGIPAPNEPTLVF